MSQETVEQTFTVGSPARLKLANIRGRIDIQPGEDGVVAITAVKHLDSGDANQTQIRIEQEENGRVVAKTEFASGFGDWFGLRKPCKVDYTIRLPKHSQLKASGVSCSISVQGLDGAIDLNSVSGELTLKELSGQLKISAVSGAIAAEGLQGELDANCVSGSIRVMDSQLSKAFVKTVSGSMVLQTPLLDGPYTFNGVSGSTTLIVPENTACTARFHSISGRMRTSLPVTKDSRSGSRGIIEIQGGGVEVACKCVSGSLRIVKTEDERITEQKAQVEPSPAVPPNTDRMEMLKRIEKGEISVDEALKELNA